MKTISRVAAAFVVSGSLLATAHAEECRSICGPCDDPCEAYWTGMISDRPTGGGDVGLAPAALVQVADAKSDYKKKSKREAVEPLNKALQNARFDAKGQLLAASKEEISKAVESVRAFTTDPLVGFISPNLSVDPRILLRVQSVNRLFKKISKERITLY